MGLALGENGDKDIRASHFLATGRLNVERRALHDPLEAIGGLGLFLAVDHEVFKFGVEILNDGLAQRIEVDAACPQDRRRIDVVDQRQQQMFESSRIHDGARWRATGLDEGSFRARGRKLASGAFHFFSIMHCKGCWFLRA